MAQADHTSQASSKFAALSALTLKATAIYYGMAMFRFDIPSYRRCQQAYKWMQSLELHAAGSIGYLYIEAGPLCTAFRSGSFYISPHEEDTALTVWTNLNDKKEPISIDMDECGECSYVPWRSKELIEDALMTMRSGQQDDVEVTEGFLDFMEVLSCIETMKDLRWED